MSTTGIGIIGCGVISGIYLKNIARLPGLELRGVADQRPEAAQAASDAHGVPALSVDALLARDDIDIVVNLTIPAAHATVGRRVLDAGKHLYLEKPLSATFGEAHDLMERAEAKGLRVGSAPDTFMGGGHQAARALLDEGRIGRPIGGSATLMLPGHERWHPNPNFYYAAEGGGPLMDMGPYYLTALVNLLGPVAEVVALAARPRDVRIIGTGPRAGETVPVDVDTHISGSLRFGNGAIVQISMSFDVAAHWHAPIEIYGTEGSMKLPDPNRFDGEVELSDGECVAASSRGWGDDNWRGVGLSDMAAAIREARPHRADGTRALHVLEVIEALHASARERRATSIQTTCARPEPMPAQQEELA